MPTDPIDRRAAKDAMIALVLGILKPKVTEPWIREIESAIDKLPALDADGRWENEINSLIGDYQASLNRGACKGDTGEGILRLVVMHLSKIRERLTSGDAAQREE